MTTEYVYSSLDPTTDAIRLLHIEKGPLEDLIRCRLFESYPDQERGVAYKALSYTWGGSGPMRIIDIDGCRVQITQNLFLALKEIRLETLDITLWVDALCINQGDKNEKGHQVKKMGKIYTGAEEVLIWLGPSDDSDISLMNFMVWIDNMAIGAKTMGTKEDWPSLCCRFMKERFWSRGTDTHSTQGRTLQQLLNRPWFSRVWIIQEVALARSAKVMCGSQACSARTFALIPSLMGLEVNERTQAVLDIMPRLRTDTWWSSKRYLHFLLAKFTESQASKPRDKVYALLGISEDANDPKGFYPCYEKSDSQVVRDTLSFLLFGQIMDSSFAFPDLTYQDLSRPVHQLAAKTLKWTLNTTVVPDQTNELRVSSRKTAEHFVARMKQGQFKLAKLLSSIAETEAEYNHQLHNLFSDGDESIGGDINVDLAFEGEQATLMIASNKGIRVSATLTFPVEDSRVIEGPQESTLVPAPFEDNENMTEVILHLKEIEASKEDLLRAYTWAGDIEGVRAQLEDGASVNGADSNGSTALHFAARRSYGEILDLLLNKGADPNKQDILGNSALHIAVSVAA